MLPVLTELFNYILTSSTLFGKFLALFLFPKFILLQSSLTNALFLFYLSLQRLLKMVCSSRWLTTSAAMVLIRHFSLILDLVARQLLLQGSPMIFASILSSILVLLDFSKAFDSVGH
jgi:hypothetical protein